MHISEKIIAAAVLGICIFWLIITLFILTFHFFLPDPFYTVHSYTAVVTQEIQWGMQNFFTTFFLLFFPIAGILISASLSSKWTGKRRVFLMVGSSILLSTAFTFREISSHLSSWIPLEKATHSMKERTFTLDRTSFLPMKQFTINFTTEGSDLSFLPEEIIPILTSYGYEITESSMNNDLVQERSFYQPLQNLDYADINFHHTQSFQRIWLITDNYRGNHSIEGMLRLN